MEKELFELFWRLSSRDPQQRLEAAESLTSSINSQPLPATSALQKQQVFEFYSNLEINPCKEDLSLNDQSPLEALLTPSLSYALKRLTRGLASGRDCSREGFATALTHLLRLYTDVIPVEFILDRIFKYTSVDTEHGSSNSQEKDGFYGQIVGFKVLLLWNKPLPHKCVRLMAQALEEIAAKKLYLQQACYHLIGELNEAHPDLVPRTHWTLVPEPSTVTAEQLLSTVQYVPSLHFVWPKLLEKLTVHCATMDSVSVHSNVSKHKLNSTHRLMG